MAAAITKDKVKLSEKRDLGSVPEGNLKANGKYVNYVSPDYTTMLTSGYDVSTGSKATRTLVKPSMFTVKHGENANEMELAMSPVRGATHYIFLVTPAATADNDLWKVIVSSSASATAVNLEAMKAYAFKGIAAGPNSTVVYTDILVKSV